MKFLETCSSTVMHTWSAMKIYFQIYSTEHVTGKATLFIVYHSYIQQLMLLYSNSWCFTE